MEQRVGVLDRVVARGQGWLWALITTYRDGAVPFHAGTSPMHPRLRAGRGHPRDLRAVGVPGQKLNLTIGDGGGTVPRTAKAGTVVGEVTVGTGAEARTVPAALGADLTEPSFGAKLTERPGRPARPAPAGRGGVRWAGSGAGPPARNARESRSTGVQGHKDTDEPEPPRRRRSRSRNSCSALKPAAEPIRPRPRDQLEPGPEMSDASLAARRYSALMR